MTADCCWDGKVKGVMVTGLVAKYYMQQVGALLPEKLVVLVVWPQWDTVVVVLLQTLGASCSIALP